MITGKRLAPKLRNLPNVTTDGVKILKTVNSAALLGLEIDMLSFNLHVEMICKRLCSRIAVLRKIKVFLPLSQRLLYYNAIIRPVLSYINNSRHLARKYAWIFVRGHYLFLEANSFPRAKLEESCELRGTDNVQGQISELIFFSSI